MVGRHGDGWKVRVAEAPERGRANDAVLALLARTLGVPRASADARLRPRGARQGRRAGRHRARTRSSGGSRPPEREADGGRHEPFPRGAARTSASASRRRSGTSTRRTRGHRGRDGRGRRHARQRQLRRHGDVTYDREIDYSLEENSETVLREIDAALQRIEDGTYGVCEGLRQADRGGAARGDPVDAPLHRRRAQAGDAVNEPARVVDVRVGSSNDALTPFSSAERSLAARPWQWLGARRDRDSRRSPPTS